ncbi:uncharacterized protein LOC117748123 [Cyclopterus lumpus]|uniref:uncharacterized protein LOC117748123 n=1 Tax=Cyclopterus lumpus TaxID=8103 RepID=UPI0014874248|nr:uncharacterized protein LOC117748123 [Cyclopterus lumpus]
MGLTLVCVPGLFLMNILLYCGHAQDIWLSTDPNRSTFFTGESVTFTCDVRTGEETDWYYSFRRNGVNFLFYSTDKIIRSPPVTPGFTEKYQCYATHKRSSAVFIESNKVSLTVTDKPKPVLTVSPLWPSPGDSVTLTCRVEHPSAGWRFFWYQVVPKLESYSYELLPGSSTGTEEDSFIVHGQTHTAGYVCRAGRGDPLFYSSYSEPQFIWSGDFHPAASLTVSPPRMQFFSKESLSLSCEGNSPEWRVRRFIKYVHLAYCSSLGTMTGSTCSINSIGISGVYWCESETGQFSNAANITVQSGDVILVSSVHPVTEGHSVTLSCRLRTEKVLYKVDFYKNDKLISNDASGELFISEVTKSDEGFYKCEGRDSPQGFRSLTSPESWLSVKSATTSSPVPVLLVVGLVCGVSLIILLLLVLYCYRKSKDSRLVRSQSTNQSPATDHVTNQVETQNNAYASLLHGDSCLYETIRGSEEPGHGNNNEPEESVYSNVTMGTAAALWKRGGSLTEEEGGENVQSNAAVSNFAQSVKATKASQKQSGVRMGLTLCCVLGLFLMNILLDCGHARGFYTTSFLIKSSLKTILHLLPLFLHIIYIWLSVDPNRSTFFTGEYVTFVCDLGRGENPDWYYSISLDGKRSPPNSPKKRLKSQSLTSRHSGGYQCIAAHKSSPAVIIESNTISITVTERPKARLSKGSPVGGSVSLTCSVSSSSPSSSGWKYFWYRGKKTSEPLITRDDVLLTNGRIGVSQGGGGGGGEGGGEGGGGGRGREGGGEGVYWCRGGSGDPVYYTEYSTPAVTHRAVVTLQPDWPVIYSGETITLTCDIKDGGEAEWEYRWETSSSPRNPSGPMIRPSHSGDYWCRGRLNHETSSTLPIRAQLQTT